MSSLRRLVAMLFVIGCSESPERAPLLASVPELAGDNCADGGTAVLSGLDDNGNGVLDPAEVTSTAYVCAGQARSLVAVVAEPAGANCATGGQAIKVGVDSNDDGVLDEDEVLSTTYVCEPSAPTTLRSLLRVISEPAGANCPSGGQALETGVDVNNNSVLDDNEVQSTSYLCAPWVPTNSTIEGSVIVRNSLDAAQLVGVTTINGDLTIDGNGLTSLDLSSLQTVSGTIGISRFSGTTLAFPALLSATSLWLNGEVALTTLSLPVLTSIDLLTIDGPSLDSVSFPQLTSVLGISLQRLAYTSLSFAAVFPMLTSLRWVSIDRFPSLTSFTLGGVNIEQEIGFASNPALVTIDLASLTSGGLFIADNPSLTSLDVSSLTTASYRIFIRYNDALTTLAFPSLTAAATQADGLVMIADNALLQSISAPNWTTFGGSGARYFGIYSNPKLPTCAAQALAMQVGATNVNIAGNNTAATCP